MAHHKAALKSIRQDERRTDRNRYFKSTMRTQIKLVRNLVEENKVEEARQLLPKACGVIDKCVTKKIIHKNTAARYKSGLSRLLARQQPAAKAAKPARTAKAAKPKTVRAAKPKAAKAEKPAETKE